jgi:hypothetical protein
VGGEKRRGRWSRHGGNCQREDAQTISAGCHGAVF